ncbi:MAG: hypothetical protein CFE45_22615 [Burkholderiales bacterium PBB5]|nr:MAG: hypothetical protein CFE45_22615 [Burkholderiales bacterium PBB5]
MKARLNLPDVTLVCVDTRTPALGIAAMQRCQAQVQFADALLFTELARVPTPPAGIRLLPLQIDSVPAYSDFMLRGLLPHITTSHLLVVQWDGYVLDAGQWDPAWLQCDYLGAPLRNEPPERAVGNGGFSLRSRRLLQALQDPALAMRHPEDICICHDHRAVLEQRHGLRFGSLAQARRFAYERVLPDAPTFGFHGLFNLHRVMPAAELHALVASLPDGLARGLDAHDLCAELIRQGQLGTAALVLAARKRLGMNDRRTWRLRWRFALARLRGGGASGAPG